MRNVIRRVRPSVDKNADSRKVAEIHHPLLSSMGAFAPIIDTDIKHSAVPIPGTIYMQDFRFRPSSGYRAVLETP